MKKYIHAIITVLCAIALHAALTANAQTTPDPRIGSWDEQKVSAYYDGALRVFETAENGMTRLILNAKLIAANRYHVDFKCDGSVYRVLTPDGKFTGMTYSCRRTGPLTFESKSTREKPDSSIQAFLSASGDFVSATGTETVSADGQTLLTTSAVTYGDGHTVEIQKKYTRRP